ncbi:Rv0361 family membrane protein [Mycolicibacterium sp. XJ1819]
MGRLVCALGVAAALTVLAPGTAGAATDQDRVRDVLVEMNDAYNRFDFATFATYLCTDVLRVEGFQAHWQQSRRTDGPTRIAVNSVNVAGDPASVAVANVRFEAVNHEQPKTLDVEFVREGAEWKACRYRAGRTV